MAAKFNSSNLTLSDLFTNATNTSKTTNVFGNGQMQAMVFPTASYTYYEDSVEEDVKDEIKEYLAENTNIYVISQSGDKKLLTWTKSTKSNEFLHDVNESSTSYSSAAAEGRDSLVQRKTDWFSVPIYFLVPKGTIGTFTWIAELNGIYTKIATAVRVSSQQLSLMPENFQIIDLDAKNSTVLRVLKYNHIGTIANTSVKLKKCSEYVGLKFDDGNCWISLTQARPVSQLVSFVEYNETSPKIATLGKKYGRNDFEKSDNITTNYSSLMPYIIREATSNPYKDAESFTVDWSTGIPMILLKECIITTNGTDVPLVLDPDNFHIKLQDNYGNVVSVKLDLNYDGFYHWKVTDVVVY